MAWLGAVVGGVASYMGSKESNKGSKNAGKVDVYHQNTQLPGTEAYRNAAANRAYLLTFGKPAPLSSLTDPDDPRLPNKPGGAGQKGLGGRDGAGGQEEGDLGQFTPIATPSTAGGGRKKGKGGKGGGGKGAATPGTTKTAINEAMRVAGEMEKSPTVTAAQDYASGTLRGEDQNPYREETAGMLRDLNESGAGANYQRLLDELWGSETGMGAGGGGASKPVGANVRYGMSSTDRAKLKAIEAGQVQSGVGRHGQALTNPNNPGGAGMVGIEQNLEDLLAGKPQPGLEALQATQPMVGAADSLKSLLAGDDSPAMQGMREKIKRQGDEALAEQQRALRLRAAGSGNYGGSGQDYAEGTAMGKYGGYLADANAQMYSDLYGQALGLGSAMDTASQDRAAALYGQGLGLGTQYDISAQDRAAQERMNSENASASASASGAGARMAAEMQANDIASREKMQRLSMLGDMTGMGLDTEKFRASGMGSLGEGFSGDQRNALSLAGDTNGLGQAGWLNAGGLSLGSDQTQNSLRASLANTGVARQSLEFDKSRYYGEKPMRDLIGYSGLISGLYDPYAGSHDFGFDARSQSPSYSNPAAQGLAGAAAGYSLASQMR